MEKISNTRRKLVVTLGTEFPLLQQRPQLACPVSLVAVSEVEERLSIAILPPKPV